MKETVTVIIDDNSTKGGNVFVSGQAVPVKSKNKTAAAFKRILLSSIFVLKRQPQLPIAVLGTTVKKYRFGLAVAGLAFMFIFRNDKTHALSYQAKGAELQQASMISGTESGVTAMEESAVSKEKSAKSESKPKYSGKNSRKLQKSEQEKVYHLPVIPDAVNRSKSVDQEFGRYAQKIREEYISRYASIARKEQDKFKIPASVTLGLAILNSGYGQSDAVKEGNNHFSVTCGENTVPMGKGMDGQLIFNDVCYTSYESAWAGFRAHSKFLQKNYKKISSKGDKSHFIFIKELEAAGYFKNKAFSAASLLNIIEKENLTRFDK